MQQRTRPVIIVYVRRWSPTLHSWRSFVRRQKCVSSGRRQRLCIVAPPPALMSAPNVVVVLCQSKKVSHWNSALNMTTLLVSFEILFVFLIHFININLEWPKFEVSLGFIWGGELIKLFVIVIILTTKKLIRYLECCQFEHNGLKSRFIEN